MPKIPVIGIAGKARTGKDTTAKFIQAHNGGYIYSFADPIREMLIPFGIDMRDPFWQDHKETVIPVLNASPRRLMQTLGTEWGRELINPNIWTLMAHQKLLHDGYGMIIPDVRFDNEAKFIRKINGVVIHLHRPDAVTVEAHASEAGVTMLPEDYLIVNDGTLEDLQHSVRSLLDGLAKT